MSLPSPAKGFPGASRQSMPFSCPACGRKVGVRFTEDDIPHFGRVILSALSCENCGFKSTDVMPAEQREPARYTLRVENEEDLSHKVVKSSTGSLEIPELGLSVESGPASDGYVSNVEGVLERAEAAVKVIANSAEGAQKANAEKSLRQLRAARDGKIAFTLILSDGQGNSGILGEKVQREVMSWRRKC